MCVLKVNSTARDGIDANRYDAMKSNQSDESGHHRAKSKLLTKEQQRKERERLVLWREPVLTLKYGSLEMWEMFTANSDK